MATVTERYRGGRPEHVRLTELHQSDTFPTATAGSDRLRREGREPTIVTCGVLVRESLQAAARLEEKADIDVAITDLRAFLPPDGETSLSVVENDRSLVVHEETRTGDAAGGIDVHVCGSAFEWLDAPILRMTAIDTPVPYSPVPGVRTLPWQRESVQACRYLAQY